MQRQHKASILMTALVTTTMLSACGEIVVSNPQSKGKDPRAGLNQPGAQGQALPIGPSGLGGPTGAGPGPIVGIAEPIGLEGTSGATGAPASTGQNTAEGPNDFVSGEIDPSPPTADQSETIPPVVDAPPSPAEPSQPVQPGTPDIAYVPLKAVVEGSFIDWEDHLGIWAEFPKQDASASTFDFAQGGDIPCEAIIAAFVDGIGIAHKQIGRATSLLESTINTPTLQSNQLIYDLGRGSSVRLRPNGLVAEIEQFEQRGRENAVVTLSGEGLVARESAIKGTQVDETKVVLFTGEGESERVMLQLNVLSRSADRMTTFAMTVEWFAGNRVVAKTKFNQAATTVTEFHMKPGMTVCYK